LGTLGVWYRSSHGLQPGCELLAELTAAGPGSPVGAGTKGIQHLLDSQGFTNYWDTYFAGRAAPLGLAAAEVVDALFYSFAPGEVARHIPKVWRTTTPAAIAA
jgi:hypothetical protein